MNAINQTLPVEPLAIFANPAPVMFKLNSCDLSDYFEGYNSEQTLIALEGALNIIFNPDILLGKVDDGLTLAEDNGWDSVENNITSETVFNLVNRHDSCTVMTHEELIEAFTSSFDAIVNKLSEDITGDHYNSDVATIYAEMTTFNNITVNSYLYEERSNVLRVYLTFNMY
ncbi:hypothetical protein AVP1_0208 [Aeromonas phage AVP1]|nr:hypothetical protein AVP1_0208 [Aeromonas phage AVP1]